MSRSKKLTVLLLAFLLSGCSSSLVMQKNESGDFLERFHAAQKKLRHKRNNPEAHYEMARLYLESGDTIRAFAHLDTALSLKPDYSEARLLKGNLLYERRQIRAAFEEYLVLLEQDSSVIWSQKVGESIGLLYPLRQVTSEPWDHANPACSPDGRYVVFQGNKNQNWDLFLLDRETQEVKQLTSDPLNDESPVFWDATTILFTREVDPLLHRRDIYQLDLQTGTIEAVVSSPADDWFPAAEPGGRRFLFVSDRSDSLGQTGTAIFLYENGQVRELVRAPFPVGAPAFAPSGEEFYFVGKEGDFYALYRYRFEERSYSRVTDLQMHFGAPRPSPDGEKVVFFSKLGDNFDVFELNLETNELVRLTAHSARDLAPVYSADGNHILFYSNRMGEYQLFEFDRTRTFTRIELMERLRAALQKEKIRFRDISAVVRKSSTP